MARRTVTLEDGTKLRPSEWREVTDKETDEARALVGRVYNGCTHTGLGLMFGEDNVRHVMGIGWFVRITK